MKKVKLYYRMLESNNADAETKDGTTLAIVTDGIAQRLLEGQKVGKVVCYLIALASLQGWNGGCFLLDAEDITEQYDCEHNTNYAGHFLLGAEDVTEEPA